MLLKQVGTSTWTPQNSKPVSCPSPCIIDMGFDQGKSPDPNHKRMLKMPVKCDLYLLP